MRKCIIISAIVSLFISLNAFATTAAYTNSNFTFTNITISNKTVNFKCSSPRADFTKATITSYLVGKAIFVDTQTATTKLYADNAVVSNVPNRVWITNGAAETNSAIVLLPTSGAYKGQVMVGGTNASAAKIISIKFE